MAVPRPASNIVLPCVGMTDDYIEARDVEPGDTIDGLLVVLKTEGVTARRGPFVDLTVDFGPDELTVALHPLDLVPNHVAASPDGLLSEIYGHVIDVEAID